MRFSLAPSFLRNHCIVLTTVWLVAGAFYEIDVNAQQLPSSPETVSQIFVEELEQSQKQMLEQAVVFGKNGRWDDALDLVMRTQEEAAGRMVRVASDRFVPVEVHCRTLLATYPPETLARYRRLVDPRAERLYRNALETRDPRGLRTIINELFASSRAGDALWALSEFSLQSGHPARAKEYLIPLFIDPFAKADAKANALSATGISQADVWARWIVCEIAEGRWVRAEDFLRSFAERFPDAPGRLGGKQGTWPELLTAYLTRARASAISTPKLTHDEKQGTLAGNASRNDNIAERIRPRMLAWAAPIALSGPWQSDIATVREFELPERRPAENARRLNAVYPVVADGLVISCDETRVYAFDARTGLPAWNSPQRAPGEIYRTEVLPTIDFAVNAELLRDAKTPGIRAQGARSYRGWGTPRFTVTVQDGLALARLGWPGSAIALDRKGLVPTEIVCLNLARQGFPQWTIRPPGERWTFEGTPVCDRENAYVALRYHDARPQWHVACYDLHSGQPRWRTKVCSGESFGNGRTDELVNALLTLHEGRLFLRTNQGAVAALDAETGRTEWIALYPRARSWNQAEFAYRDLCPPLAAGENVYVAPQDSPRILAYEAATGRLLWSAEHVDDVVHLLGVGDDCLIATGRQVRWIDTATGQVKRSYPEVADRDLGANAPLGRGLLADGAIYWPQAGQLAVLEQSVSHDRGRPALRRVVPLAPLALELTGGNLYASGSLLTITTSERIWALGPESAARRRDGTDLAERFSTTDFHFKH